MTELKKSSSLHFWRKSHKDDNKEDQVTTDQSTEHPEDEVKDVNLVSFFLPFLKNYASSFSTTKGNPGRLPYPPRFYLPQSSLQHTMSLKMSHIGLLETAVDIPDPLGRFLCVLKYFFSVVSLTKFPYKPIIAMEGETSHHFVSHTDSSRTYSIAEEIVHDPPYAAFYICNPDKGIVHDGCVNLEPKFEKGHVRVHIAGVNRIVLQHPQGLFNETYENTVPDLMIRLLRMHTECIGEAAVTCQTTGYSARITFKEKPLFGGSKNAIVGSVSWNGREIFRLDGIWDDCIFITDENQQRTEFLNRKILPRDKIETPPLESLPVTAGERIWGPLVSLLKQENFTEAQTLKLQLNQKENAERAQRRANNVQPTFFNKNAAGWWEIKDPTRAVSFAMQGMSA